MTKEEFGERLKRWRDESGLSQLHFGLQCEDLSQSYIASLENGEKAPTLTTLDKIAYGLGMTLSELLAEDTPVEKDPSISTIITCARMLSPDDRNFAAKFLQFLVTQNAPDLPPSINEAHDA